ncbi:MAG: type II secretion system F family protein [Minisyncoccales bacterium]
MVQFSFQSKSIDGKEQKGVREAESEIELAHSLRQEGFILIRATPASAARKFRIPTLSLGVSLKDKMFFCKNLQVMASAGLSLPRAVGILADQSGSSIFRRTLNSVKDDMIRGEAFSAAMEKHPNVFSDFLRSMVKVGEETGTLENVLGIAVNQMEKEYSLKSKVKGALVYPAVILTAMVGIGMLMLATVVPQLAATFKELKTDLPMTTKFVMSAGMFMEQYWWIVVAVFVVLVAVIARLIKTKPGKKLYDGIALRFPAINVIVRNVNSAYTLRNLSALIGAGVSLPRALEITSGTVGNVNYRDALLNIEERVKKGEKFSAAIKLFDNLYPATAIQMIAVGEETGETSNILLKLAEFYENEVDEETKNFASIIEPMLMIVIGAVVGFFAVSMVQPMYSMMDSV